ncbi:SDR family oxidoreductase [Streptomyces sp. NPDC094437]|uniref:SDR family oxidoreductase n=1 Tax=Streptomyces sp. NPDC094437 TaxID=3366060 RepID=UPI003809043D
MPVSLPRCVTKSRKPPTTPWRGQSSGALSFFARTSGALTTPSRTSRPVYAATKAAVHNLARTLGSDLAGRGIRVNSTSPGYIVTEMFDAADPDPATHDAIRSQVPLGRRRRGSGDRPPRLPTRP